MEPQIGVPEAVPMSSETAVGRDFEEFYEVEHSDLFAALWLVTRNRQEAEEIMQDAFLKLWERWDHIAGLDDPTGYLYRTAMNGFRNRSRRAALALRKTAAAAAGRRTRPRGGAGVDRSGTRATHATPARGGRAHLHPRVHLRGGSRPVGHPALHSPCAGRTWTGATQTSDGRS